MLSDTIILSLITGASAIFGLIVRYAFLSKCSSVSCCCIKIHRDIQHEINIQQNQELEQKSPQNTNNNLNNSMRLNIV